MKMLGVCCSLCIISLSACAPGLVFRSPSIDGFVTDARTHRPVSGALVVVTRGRVSLAKGPLPSGRTDTRGHFHLAAQSGLGLAYIGPGDPAPLVVPIEITRDGYHLFQTVAPDPNSRGSVWFALVPN